MKTKTKCAKLILFLTVFAWGTSEVLAHSQTPSQLSVRQLQTKRAAVYQHIIDLQNAQTVINQQIVEIQARVQARQSAIAQANQLIAASTDPNQISMYNQKIQQMNDEITNVFQANINQLQAKLAALPASIAQVQAQVNTIDSDIATAQQVVTRETAYAQQQSQPAPGRASVPAAPPQQNPAVNTPRNPNSP